MPSVTYVHPDGTRQSVDARAGDSVMETATGNDVDGIVAECGGSAMCATCHVYVDEAWADRLAPRSEVEDDLLDSTASERRTSSRLSCQLPVTAELDGLVVHLPAEQV